ncbi:hypothetical protein BJV82DRAFT_512930, partial [Fennellomyces sp. T-0311]
LKFWRMPIPHRNRTVWWRLLTKRIPTRGLLHSHMPTLAPIAACVHCQQPYEDVSHFFVFCPPKQRVWSIIARRCASDWSLSEVLTYISTLQYPQRQHHPIPDLNISIALSTIWRHHWRRIFDHQPFQAGIVARTVQQKLLEALRQPEAIESQDVD